MSLAVTLVGFLLVGWGDPASASRRSQAERKPTGKARASAIATKALRSTGEKPAAREKVAGASVGFRKRLRTPGLDREFESFPAGEKLWGEHRRPISLISPVDLIEFGNQTRAEGRPHVVERHATVRRGDSFARILRMYDVEPAVAASFERAAREVFDLSRIRPRRSLSMQFDRKTDELLGIEYSIDDRSVLVVERSGDGALDARLARTPSAVEIRGVSGTIGESTTSDCGEAGVPDRIVNDLADIFAWDVNVEALRPGDRFRVVYEAAIDERGEEVQSGAILAAQVESQGRLLTAIYHEDEDGDGAYFDGAGRSLEREQLRYPLEFTRVSSEFSESRLHPILGRHRPHFGVDFAAPTGTPVRAVAAGVVGAAGWQTDLGWTVRVEHAAAGLPYDSLYGHLSRIALSAKPGTVVRKGEIIGYVGSTGLATGPHLHFALQAGDDYLDPLRVSPPPRVDTRVPLGAGFERSRGVLLAALESLGQDGPVRATRLSTFLRTTPLLLTY